MLVPGFSKPRKVNFSFHTGTLDTEALLMDLLL